MNAGRRLAGQARVNAEGFRAEAEESFGVGTGCRSRVMVVGTPPDLLLI